MDGAAPVNPLGGITEADFATWKHHPVTQVYLRYVLDYAETVRRKLADDVCAAEAALDQLQVGKLGGRVLAWQEMATLDFQHMSDFYTPPKQEDSEQEE